MKKAFTMAEVLITLGIIGIVAAMTLPSLVGKYQKKALHTSFLKIYSDLNNASKMFEAQEGFTVQEYSKNLSTAGSYNIYDSTVTLKQFMKYFNGQSRVTSSVTETADGDTGRKDVYKRKLGYIPAALNGSDISSQPCDESIILSDISGRFFVMDNNLSDIYSDIKIGPKICVDTNGKKGPNKYGYDWFVFVFTEKGMVIPYIGNNLAGYGEDMENPADFCSYTQNMATYTCAFFALSDTSPLDESKSYWKDFLR